MAELPKIGQVIDGYKFKGGDPSKQSNWVPVNINKIESSIRGSAQGLSFGFADEILGGIGGILPGGKSPGESIDLYRQRDKAARSSNPKSFLSGEVGGGLATAFIPGLGALNAGKGARLGTQILKGALSGGIYGFGSGEGGVKERTGGAAQSAAIGGLLPVALKPVGAALKATGKSLSKGATKLSSALTGIPEKEIRTFATRFPAVKKVIQKYGAVDDFATAADDFTSDLNNALQQTRKRLNKQIDKELSGKAGQRTVKAGKLFRKLESFKERFDDVVDADVFEDINEQIELLDKSTNDVGEITLKRLNRLRKHFDKISKSGRVKQGQIIARGDDITKAYAEMTDETSRLLKSNVEGVKGAFNDFSKLYKLEQNKPVKSLLKPEGASLGTIRSAGGGTNKQAERALGNISEFLREPFLQRAEDLAAGSRFANPPWKPVETTGKSLLAPAAAGLAGFALGGTPGFAAGAALSSPLALRYLIETGRLPAKGIGALGGLMSQGNLPLAGSILEKGLLQ